MEIIRFKGSDEIYLAEVYLVNSNVMGLVFQNEIPETYLNGFEQINIGNGVVEGDYLAFKTEYRTYEDEPLKVELSNDESVYVPIELAKASDVLLTFNDIEASFVIAKIDKNTIGISARSIGNIDVEKIMKHFNGGGHRTIAATQIKDTDIEKVKNDLIYYLGGLE